MVAGCGGGPGETRGGGGGGGSATGGGGGAVDAGVIDAGVIDAGAIDAGAIDAGAIDAGAIDAGAVDAGAVDAGALDAGPAFRPVTICLTGACPDLGANCSSNQYFTDICDELALGDAGVVRSSSGTTFATAVDTDAASVAGPLFLALDRNGDNQVNQLDGPIVLNILGFSWGGKNVEDLANRVTTDSRIDQTVLYSRVVVLDAFQPFNNGAVTMPVGLDEAWSFRHSVAPSGDCSNAAPLGPYLGLRLACAAGQSCRDHDFSLAPTTFFNGLSGSSIGHCDVPFAARPYVLDLVARGQTTTPLPPSVPVSP
ncbi:MAG: hypothetical protein Q8L48_27715 [Archangium sp.]|nr:hypothetical protein [Archangium sp.]